VRNNIKILVTGAFGIVGMSVLDFLIERKYKVRIFEVKNFNNWVKSQNYKDDAEIFWGDIRNKEDINHALEEIDVVIHLAAIIPPLADKTPNLAEEVNVDGTQNLIEAMGNKENKPKLIFTSSVAIYGDRVSNPLIKIDDEPKPNPTDHYAQQKLKCEDMIKKSELDWVILRLTYIVSPKKIKMDPIMFDMPLDTHIEVCHAKDVGLAMVNAIECEKIWGKILHIAGGKKCRTTYREYLRDMFNLYGIGFDDFPEEAFSTGDFHCGDLVTDESQSLLNYQKHTLDDYYDEVEVEIGFLYYFIKFFSSLAQKYLLYESKYYRKEFN